ncbi:MAG TPA: DedA family protein [Gemmataceae bacterium]|nr:DedA family protein [Gemmataceae bacterium]
MIKMIGHLFGVELAPLDEMLGQWAGSMGLWFYALLFVVIFCETGLVVTPILPGDSLLFAVGALAAAQGSALSMPVLLVLLIVAAVVGDAVNYAIGYRLGPKVFKYERSRLFNKKHLLRAQEFYEKYGNKTIILARFVPIVRTFAPFVAGIGKMQYRRFLIYNVVGAVAWVAVCLFSGYAFGQVRWVKENFEAVAVAVVIISVLPMAVELVLVRRRRAAADKELSAVGAAAERAEE